MKGITWSELTKGAITVSVAEWIARRLKEALS